MVRQANIQIVVAAVLGAAVMAGATMLGQGSGQAVAALGDGLPDTGALAMQTNAKLDEVNGNLRAINEKLGQLVELLQSGQLEVVAKDKRAPAAAGTAPAGGGAAGSGAGQGR